MISVSVQGANGKLGTKIVEHLEQSETFIYAGPILRDLSIPSCDVIVSVAGAEGTSARWLRYKAKNY